MRSPLRGAFAIVLAASVLLANHAHAEDPPEPTEPSTTLELPSPPPMERTHRLEWHWKRVHWGEVAATVALTATSIGVGAGVEPPPRWTRTNAFDDWFRDRLRVSSTAQRRTGIASDVLGLTVFAFPVAVDAIGVTLIGDRNKQVGGQLVAIQAQAYTMTGFLTAVTKVAAGRERPFAQEDMCDELDLDCGRGVNKSFFSGHSSFAFTGAGLTCVEHQFLPLFGRVGDPLACATTLTLATLTGVFRITANKHWATDVLTGAGVGLFSGWLMPWLLHFRHDTWDDTSKHRAGHVRWLQFVAPYGNADGVGLRAAGAF